MSRLISMRITIDLGDHYDTLTLELDDGETVIGVVIGTNRTVMNIAEAKLTRANLDALIAQAEANDAL